MGIHFIYDYTPRFSRFAYKFTGKERDAESGLDYFGARYYGSTMARFTSPDDGSDQLIGEPQSWNLYSYGRNNPVTDTDADGRSVSICSANSFGDQQCQTISDDAYKAAQQASNSGGLSGTSLSNLQNSASGSGTITDSSGATVGTVQWTADNPVSKDQERPRRSATSATREWALSRLLPSGR